MESVFSQKPDEIEDSDTIPVQSESPKQTFEIEIDSFDEEEVKEIPKDKPEIWNSETYTNAYDDSYFQPGSNQGE